MALGLIVACGDPTQATMSRSEFEDAILVPASDREVVEMELVGDCMRLQGFDFQPSLEAQETRMIDPLPGVTDINERVERIGSGLVAATQLQLTLENSDTSAVGTQEENLPEFDADYQRALMSEAIVDGAAIDGGCIAWAANEYLERNPDERLRIEVEADYALKMASAREDAVMAALNVEWASCMAGYGFDGLSEPGDHYAAIRLRINDAVNSDDERQRASLLEAALEFDIEISTANLDCFRQIEDARAAVLTDYYSTFLQENQEPVAALMRQAD